MVTIKDFEMPKKCIWDCPLCREDGGACQISSVATSDIERPKECPLVEIPDCGKPLEAERMEEQCSKQNR